jgi:hypothetical protein
LEALQKFQFLGYSGSILAGHHNDAAIQELFLIDNLIGSVDRRNMARDRVPCLPLRTAFDICRLAAKHVHVPS